MRIENYLDMSVYSGSFEFKIFVKVINKGIDSRLTAFTKSKFKLEDEGRLFMYFDYSEIEILLRRLIDQMELIDDREENEQQYEDISQWIDDIINACYGNEA